MTGGNDESFIVVKSDFCETVKCVKGKISHIVLEDVMWPVVAQRTSFGVFHQKFDPSDADVKHRANIFPNCPHCLTVFLPATKIISHLLLPHFYMVYFLLPLAFFQSGRLSVHY